MRRKRPNSGAVEPTAVDRQPRGEFEAKILRLVRSAPERRAVALGQVDAILDPTSGRLILSPGAQATLIETNSRFRSLVALASDGYWEQDALYRFVLYEGPALAGERAGDDSLVGKTLWESSCDRGSDVDWQTHRTQMEWRAVFRELEIPGVDRAGMRCTLLFSGEPRFDANGCFAGYRGIVRYGTGANRLPSAAAAAVTDHLARAIIEALGTPLCVLDKVGSIVTANPAWRECVAAYADLAAGFAEGGNYLAACRQIAGAAPEDADARAMAIGQVVAGERKVFRYECCCDMPSGPHWFAATATGLHADGAVRAVVAHEDITELKRAAQLLKLENDVVRCLAAASDTSAALKAVIRTVCATQNWVCGQYFCLDSAALVLHFEESWSVPVAAVEQFIEKARGAVFRCGTGLAGRVCESGEPLWIRDISKDAYAARTALAHETGMQGAFFFPVLAGDRTVGVLGFASLTGIHEPDDRMLRAMRGIGDQLGHFLQRRQAEDTLRETAARFRALTEIAADWYWETDRDLRFTSAVGGGMAGIADILGKTLWEIPAIVVSDEKWTRHKAELAARWSFSEFEYAAVLPLGRRVYYSISGAPIYDDAGVFAGYQGVGLDITERRRAEHVVPQPES